MLELPRGSVVCDIDNQGNIFKTLEDIGHHQCIAGGLPYSMFIIGSPQEMRDQGLSALDIIDECNAGMVDQEIDKMSAAFIFAMVGVVSSMFRILGLAFRSNRSRGHAYHRNHFRLPGSGFSAIV